ncbi:MAG: Stage III sporulation protein AG [Firmicutes bacterium]|nr:Stage III sporulation protein AG [Bacillota bacterium]MDI6705396.1 stage III sporulation protein AG [Bacillota bacterium]
MVDFKEIKGRLKEIGSKKTLQNLLILLLIAAITVIASSTFLDSSRQNRNSIGDSDIQLNKDLNLKASYEEQIETKLKNTLEQISGVGEVSVMITLKVGKEIVPASNVVETESETNERDSDGGTRTVLQQSADKKVVVNSGSTASDQPLIVKEIMPEVKGVIVVAEGAEHPEVEARLTEAVQTVLGIPAFRVKVYPR